MTEIPEVQVFVDWENIRRGLAETYIERVDVDKVIIALDSLVKDLGRLKNTTFYGDFTLRRDEARKIQSRRPHYDFKTVLRSESQRDRSDAVIVADIMELIHQPDSAHRLLLCSGDSGFCDVVQRVLAAKKEIFICVVSSDLAAELRSLAPFYPIERYYPEKLTPKGAVTSEPKVVPKEYLKWAKFIEVVGSLENRLPFVAFTYLQNSIMPMYSIGGPSSDDRFAYLETARERDLISITEIDDTKRPGRQLRVVKLNRDNTLVKQVLAQK